MVLKSKAWSWDWDSATTPQWEEPAGDVYPLLSRWKKQNFKKILDLGCGLGRHAVLFAEAGFEVAAFDLSQEGLNKLKKVSDDKKLNIEIVEGDMISLPFFDSNFDCLLAYHSVYHQDDSGIRRVVEEIKRVLKKGGEAYISFNSKESSAYKSDKVKRITDNTIVKTEGHEAGIPHYYAAKEDIENLLEDFEILEFSYLEQYYLDYTGAHYFVLVKKI